MLKVTEIFYSLQGETTFVGLPTVFVRLTGCPLRCGYCDTAYAFSGGKNYSIDEIVSQIKQYSTRYVTVSGGEPLAQKACVTLLKRLCDDGYEVSLETSGALDISAVDPRVVKIVDIKTPGSLEVHRNRYENINLLQPHDQVKFVICSQDDYQWSVKKARSLGLFEKQTVLFSPSFGQVAPAELADWILADQLPLRFQMQMHKAIWGDVAGK